MPILLAGLASTILAVPAPAASSDSGSPATISAAIQAKGKATLADCYLLALAASETVGVAEERLVQARARESAGFGTLLPQVSLQGSAFRQNEVVLEGTGNVVATDPEREELKVRLDQAVTRFGAEWSGVKELRSRTEAERRSREDTLRTLYRQVAYWFCEVLYRQREVLVRSDTVKAAGERLREMEARREVGLARRAEALRIQAQLSSEEAALVEARTTLELATRELVIVVGRPIGVPLDEALEIPTGEEGAEVTDEVIAAAVRARSDIEAAQAAAEADRLHVGLVRGEFLPRLDLGGNWYVDRNGYSEYQKRTDWDATLTLSLSLFSGASSKARLAEAQARARESALGLSLTERKAEQEIRAALVALRSAAVRLRTLEDGVRAADESARLAEEEYRQGISTNLEVETAEVSLRQARLDLERQRLRLVLARVELETALGRLPAAAVRWLGEDRGTGSDGGGTE